MRVVLFKIACGYQKTIHSTFMDLSLPVGTLDGMDSVQSLCTDYIKAETIHDYNCEEFNAKGVDKWVEITSPPTNLIVVLNRFAFNMQSMQNEKLFTDVRIDETVQIGQFCYNLYGVLVHTGASSTKGHYYFVGKKSEAVANQWFCIDDSQVKPVDVSYIHSLSKTNGKRDDSPYVLFYRCSLAPPSPECRVAPRHMEYMYAKQRGEGRAASSD